MSLQHFFDRIDALPVSYFVLACACAVVSLFCGLYLLSQWDVKAWWRHLRMEEMQIESEWTRLQRLERLASAPRLIQKKDGLWCYQKRGQTDCETHKRGQ